MLGTFLLLLAPTCQAETAPAEPRFTSLVITEGIRGGIISPMVRRHVELGFDWNAGHYRVTVYDATRWEAAEGPYSTAVLGRQEFEEILRGVREPGLKSLPPQPDPRGPDTYGLDTGLRFHDGDLIWENKATGGCVASSAEVLPTGAEQRAFADIVNGVFDAIADIELEPGCELDSDFLFRPANDQEARAFLKALEHVQQQPLCALIDRSRVDVLPAGEYYRFRFAWRPLQDLANRYSHKRRKESCDVLIERETLAFGGVSCTTYEPSDETLASRRAFLESHPGLPSRFRRLIATGWITRGMTAQMVIAAWGEPCYTNPLALVYERHGRRVQADLDRAGLLRGAGLFSPWSGYNRKQ